MYAIIIAPVVNIQLTGYTKSNVSKVGNFGNTVNTQINLTPHIPNTEISAGVSDFPRPRSAPDNTSLNI